MMEGRGCNEDNQTNALLRAAYEGNVELLAKMIADGIRIDVANQGGLQAIHFACKSGRVDAIDELISRGANVDAKSSKGNTPLHVAALLGQSDVVKLLLRRGANVNAIAECNEDEFTPLYMAAQIGDQEIVMLLLANGADPTVATTNGCTPCDVALQQGHRAVSELLAEYEKRMNGEIPDDECKENGEPEISGEAAEADDKMTSQVVIRRANPARKPRPKSGPPPVCQEPIPSPKPSPMKINKSKAESP